MKIIYGLFLMVILLISLVPLVNADLSKKQKEDQKGKYIEHKIDVLLILCKSVDAVKAYDYCFEEGLKIYKHRYYQYADPPHRVIFESKLLHWAHQIVNS